MFVYVDPIVNLYVTINPRLNPVQSSYCYYLLVFSSWINENWILSNLLQKQVLYLDGLILIVDLLTDYLLLFVSDLHMMIITRFTFLIDLFLPFRVTIYEEFLMRFSNGVLMGFSDGVFDGVF